MVPLQGFWTMKPCPWPAPGVCCWAMLSPPSHQAHPDMQKKGLITKIIQSIEGYAWLSSLKIIFSDCISGFIAVHGTLAVPNVRDAHWQMDGHVLNCQNQAILWRPEVRGSPDQGDQEQKTWLWRPAGIKKHQCFEADNRWYWQYLTRSDNYW